jgi:hypothetical protein
MRCVNRDREDLFVQKIVSELKVLVAGEHSACDQRLQGCDSAVATVICRQF